MQSLFSQHLILNKKNITGWQKRLKNITDDELDPDDILVIFPDSLTSFSNYDMFNSILRNVGVDSIMPGKT